jgi:hypothetical protein
MKADTDVLKEIDEMKKKYYYSTRKMTDDNLTTFGIWEFYDEHRRVAVYKLPLMWFNKK